MIINGDWSWGDYKNVVDFGIAPIPMVSSTGLWPTPLVSTKGYSINVNTKGEKLEQTKLLLAYLISPEVQLYFTKRVSSQPSSKKALESDIVKKNKLLNASANVIQKGRPMPVVPEMRAIWDALRTQYQAVLGGSVNANTAEAQAQQIVRTDAPWFLGLGSHPHWQRHASPPKQKKCI